MGCAWRHAVLQLACVQRARECHVDHLRSSGAPQAAPATGLFASSVPLYHLAWRWVPSDDRDCEPSPTDERRSNLAAGERLVTRPALCDALVPDRRCGTDPGPHVYLSCHAP